MPNANLPFPAMFVAVVQKSAHSQSNLTGDGTLSSPTIVPVPVLQAPGSTAGCPPPFLLLGAPTLSMFPAPDRPRAGWPPPEWNGPKGADRPFWTSNLLPYNRVLRHSPFETRRPPETLSTPTRIPRAFNTTETPDSNLSSPDPSEKV